MLQEASPDDCNTNTVHQRSAGASQQTTNSLPSKLSIEKHCEAEGTKEVIYIKTGEPKCDMEKEVVKEEFCDLHHELQDNQGGCPGCEAEWEEADAAGAFPGKTNDVKGNNSCLARLRFGFIAQEDAGRIRLRICERIALEKQTKSSESSYGRTHNCGPGDYSCFTKYNETQQNVNEIEADVFLKCKFSDSFLAKHKKLMQTAGCKAGDLLSVDFCKFSCETFDKGGVQEATKQSTGEVFKCDLCNFAGADEGLMKQHKSFRHKVKGILKCKRRRCLGGIHCNRPQPPPACAELYSSCELLCRAV
ncbi:hypothetical protein FHG87_021864 [Trinorchestia longiramus]|nr:hypothetical protein FHG87_021864 [Trinorchestia longiramus]